MEQNSEAAAPQNGETRKTIRTFAFASFFNDMGSDMIYPIWPLFVASLGANMAVLGLIDGIGNAIVSISQAISGYISDRTRKRKIFIWLGYLFGGISVSQGISILMGIVAISVIAGKLLKKKGA